MKETLSFLLRVVYPSILFAASIGRVLNAISALYFAGFVAFAVWATQRAARNNSEMNHISDGMTKDGSDNT